MRTRIRLRRACRGVSRRVTSSRLALLATVLAVGALASVTWVTPAFAGAGDFCVADQLAPANTCYGGTDETFTETEGWDSTGDGVGNCNGVANPSNGNFMGHACIGDAPGAPTGGGYQIIYCTTSCNGEYGPGFVHNHSSSYTDSFTGWGDW